MRFNDDDYVKSLIKYGEYPNIHDDIFSLDRYIPDYNVIDLGCCTGLLAHRLSKRHKSVVGVEANKTYLDKAVNAYNVKYTLLRVCEETLPELKDIISENNIKAVFARRVFPELYDTGGMQLVKNVARLFYDSGVEYIVAEGRKPTKNATNKLCGIQYEIEALSDYYDVKKTFKNCAILKRS